MSRAGGSIVLSTYQANRIGLIGFTDGRVTPVLREFDTPMGLVARQHLIALATRSEIILFANAPGLAAHYPPGRPAGHDALYAPRITYHTGDLKIHDLAFGNDGIWFVNTLCSCLAMVSGEHSFIPRWAPPFISRIAAEDRCHLNGLAMIDGAARYVTALGATDQPAGWRANKASGGVLIDVPTGQTLLTGLCMPHSPRWHDGRLWMLNSGAGELCTVDLQAGAYTPVAVLPGFLRGLGFAGPFALVGLSQIRQSNLFGGLPVKDRFPRLQCGIAIVDTRSGGHVGTLEFTSGLHELFEVQFLPGILNPMILQPQSADARRAITSPSIAYWFGAES